MGIDHVSEVVTLMEVEWLCYGGVSLMEGKRHVRFIVMEVDSLKEGESSLRRWPV